MTLESRIIGDIPNDDQLLADIVEAMRRWKVIEFIYLTKEEIKTYFCIAPLGLKAIDAKWYLFGFDRENHLLIFDRTSITNDGIGEFWATFSLPETLDFQRIATLYFSPERVE